MLKAVDIAAVPNRDIFMNQNTGMPCPITSISVIESSLFKNTSKSERYV
jgi:hypothetical protein